MNNNTITIDEIEFPVIVYKDLRVVTTELLAQAFGSDIKNIQKNFERNKDRFIEGKHFFKIAGKELKEFATVLKSVTNFSKVRSLIFWTDRGAARHAKMLETDAAWDVFEKMEDCYFEKIQPQYGLKELPNPIITTEQKRHIQETVNSIQTRQGVHYSTTYHNLKTQFKVATYAELKQSQYVEACKFLGVKPLEGDKVELPAEPFTLAFTPEQLEDLVAERIKAVEGELLAKQPEPPQNCITLQLNKESGANSLTLKFEAGDTFFSRYFICIDGGNVSIRPMADDEAALTQEQWLRMMNERGYLVVKKSEVIGKLLA